MPESLKGRAKHLGTTMHWIAEHAYSVKYHHEHPDESEAGLTAEELYKVEMRYLLECVEEARTEIRELLADIG